MRRRLNSEPTYSTTRLAIDRALALLGWRARRRDFDLSAASAGSARSPVAENSEIVTTAARAGRPSASATAGASLRAGRTTPGARRTRRRTRPPRTDTTAAAAPCSRRRRKRRRLIRASARGKRVCSHLVPGTCTGLHHPSNRSPERDQCSRGLVRRRSPCTGAGRRAQSRSTSSRYRPTPVGFPTSSRPSMPMCSGRSATRAPPRLDGQRPGVAERRRRRPPAEPAGARARCRASGAHAAVEDDRLQQCRQRLRVVGSKAAGSADDLGQGAAVGGDDRHARPSWPRAPACRSLPCATA